jgi:glycosyltransferase involved in cell wall biosynthesis
MRILHILSQRPGRSGSGIFLAAMVRQAARSSYEQHVIVAGPPGTSAAELPPLTAEQISPILFPSADAPFPLPGNSDVMPYPTTVFSQMTKLQIEQYLTVSRRVMEAVRSKFRPHVVHAHHLWLMTALAREVFSDVPLLASSHNAELRQMIKAPHLAPRMLPGIQAIDKICVLTPQSVTDTVDCFGVDADRIAVTGAGFDADLFHFSSAPHAQIAAELRERFGITLPGGEEIRLATFVGRLSSAKGIPYLLEAVARLEREALPFRLVLVLVGAVGSGEDGRKVAEMVKAAGPMVIHLGAQPQEIVAKLLQISSAFVLPSLFEGLPLTMLEALACGCPVVVSALPTVQSWVPKQWQAGGLIELVPALATTHADQPVASDVSRFVADLAAALKRQLAHQRPTESRRILANRLLPHSWSEVFKRYERVYREIVGGELTIDTRPGGVPEKVINGGAP